MAEALEATGAMGAAAGTAWGRLPLARRLRVIRALRQRIAARSAGLVAAARAAGRPTAEVLSAEVVPLADACRFLEREAPRLLAPRRLGAERRPAWLAGVTAEVRREPLGTVLVIAPATVRKHVPGPRVAQMLDHFTQYVGSAPDASPAVLCSIAHMQTAEGIWYPRGGTRAVPEALARLALDLGVEIRTGTPVSRILTADGAVTGVETAAGERIPLAAVVSNCDSVRTHRELLAGEPAARRFARRRRYEPACSGVVLYLGLDRAYPHLLHHNFVFSHDPEEEFEAIYRRGEPAADPTCYICAPARSEPEVAPAGGEALYVLVHTPYLRPHHDWRRMLPAYRRTILGKLAATAGLEDLESRIVFEAALTPQDIHGRMLGAFKPANRSRDLSGLYLAGGAAHPGPGMPMVLMSGWIAADAADRDLRPAVERSAGDGRA